LQRCQLGAFVFKAVGGTLVSGLVHAHVCHRVYPQLGGALHGTEVGQLQPCQKVLLHKADAVLDPALLVAGAHIARRYLEPPVAREVQILGVEHRSLTHQALQYR
jgi:hypothetical protein